MTSKGSTYGSSKKSKTSMETSQSQPDQQNHVQSNTPPTDKKTD